MAIAKKLVPIICLCVIFVINLDGAGNITEIYNRDYEVINRTVIVTSSKPIYSIEQFRAENKIVISLDGAKRLPIIPLKQILVSPVLETIEIDESISGKTRLIINTKQRYYLEHFYLDSGRHRIVLDIFNKETPQAFNEIIAFINFYTTVGYYERAKPLIDDIIRTHPRYTGIYYYLGRYYNFKDQPETAIESFKRVGYEEPEYLFSQIELMKRGVLSYEHDDELAQAFSQYRDFFLRASTVNRQQLVLALVSGLFGNPEETQKFLEKVDNQDPQIEAMLLNLGSFYQAILQDAKMQTKIPAAMQTFAQSRSGATYRQRLLMFLLIALIAGSIIIIYFMRRKLALLNRFAASNVEVISRELDGEPKAEEDSLTVTSKETTTEQIPDEITQIQTQQPQTEITEEMQTPEPEDLADEDEIEQADIYSEELRDKLAHKLFNEGWSAEAIANELKITVNEVEWFLTKH